MLLMEEKTTELIAEEDRITPERVQRIVEGEDFVLRAGVFLMEYADKKYLGCVVGAIAREYEIKPGLGIPRKLSEVSGLPHAYIMGVSDEFEGIDLSRRRVRADQGYTDDYTNDENYHLGREDGKVVREELLAA